MLGQSQPLPPNFNMLVTCLNIGDTQYYFDLIEHRPATRLVCCEVRQGQKNGHVTSRMASCPPGLRRLP